MKNGHPISGATIGAGRRRTSVAIAGAVGALLVLVTACGGGDPGGSDGKGDGKGGTTKGDTVGNTTSRAVVTVAPQDGATAVATRGALRITAAGGRLTTVTVQNDKSGAAVEGRIAADGASWQPARHLASGTAYRVRAVAKDADGRETVRASRFTTLVPKKTFIGEYTPEDKSTVGVGMPVSLRFSRGITDPAAVEKAITVTAAPAVPIEGHWFGNDRLDFRPEKYWAAGTKVTVKLDLDGVEGRPGVYGKQAKTVTFTVGRSQISTVDAKSKRMKVVRDGRQIKDIAITAGAAATPTYNGQMVISEKYKVTRMNGATVGFGGEYDIEDVPHAMRLSQSGTFIHGNYWAPSAFGNANVSHGCVGLRDAQGGRGNTPGAWFYDKSLIGDVVIVKNSQDKQIAPDNGLNGWNMPWAEWIK
ncbi:Ig-like domain-containing protein [Streptomyces sp. NPDC020965]|uniref:L,D-transpeptidase n=1 Tax=Streptomyces sp. NPDC020965 TaxID=3365105 RepID=UPI00379BB690